MKRQEGFSVVSIIIGVVLVGVLLIGVYALYQRSRDVASNTPLFTDESGQDVTLEQTTPNDRDVQDEAPREDTKPTNQGGQEVTTTPEELAPTGPGASLLSVLSVGALVYAAYRYALSTRQVRSL